MPLWLLFLLTFFILAIGAVGTVGYFTTVVLGKLISGTAYIDASFQSGFIAIVLLVSIGLLFLFLERVVVGPIRRLTAAIEAFTQRGELLPIITFKYTPAELGNLIRAFGVMVGSVDAAHRRDTEVSRVKSDFISTAAHQLRTPLTGIRWSLEALEKGQTTDEQKALIKSANDKIKDLVAIVSTLLDISSIESGKYHYRFTTTDIAQLLNEIMADFIPLAGQKKIVLALDPITTALQAHIDRDRIKWVLNNLVENAINYTPEGGNVRVIAERVGDRVLIRVRDTGIGISDQDRSNIFERFYRAPNAIAKQNAGNGLGLYIARTIAKDHGGDLDFTANDHGPGTTFALSLPTDSTKKP